MKRRNFIRKTAAAAGTAFAYPAVAGEGFQPAVEKTLPDMEVRDAEWEPFNNSPEWAFCGSEDN